MGLLNRRILRDIIRIIWFWISKKGIFLLEPLTCVETCGMGLGAGM